MTKHRLKDRVALITGASRGIGRAVALAFACEGAHVIAVGRNRGALEELDDEIQQSGGAVTLLRLDITNGDKIDGLGPTVLEKFGKLDVFIGNAGLLGPLSPLSHVSERDWHQVLDINLTANWRLLRTLDPLLRLSDAGRVVLVTSGAAHRCRAYWGPYSVSKAAIEALGKTYAAEIESTNVRLNLVNPGPVATAMRAKAMPGEDPETIPQPEDLTETFITLSLPACTQNGQVVDYK